MICLQLHSFMVFMDLGKEFYLIINIEKELNFLDLSYASPSTQPFPFNLGGRHDDSDEVW